MNRKKLLIFIDWYKPSFQAGGPIRSISNLVDYLHDKIDIYIITSDTDYLESAPHPNIKTNEWIKVDGAMVNYLSKDKVNYKTIKTLITGTNPDIIYCNSLYSPYFTLIPLRIAKKLQIKRILAVRGMLSKGSLSVKNNKKKIFLSIAKTIRLFNGCTFHATNASEKEDIAKEFQKNNVVITQNLPERKLLPFDSKHKEIGNLKLVSVGRIAPEKNTLYALEALKNVTTDVLFDIYGPIYSDNYWKKCKEVINLLPHNIVVNYKDVLEHDKIDKTLTNYHVLFLPSTGENFGHIIIEAMINSCIPLISDKTPWRNLQQKNVGFDLPLDDNRQYATIIDKLANMDANEIATIAKTAHQYATNIINDDKLVEDYYKLFQLNN